MQRRTHRVSAGHSHRGGNGAGPGNGRTSQCRIAKLTTKDDNASTVKGAYGFAIGGFRQHHVQRRSAAGGRIRFLSPPPVPFRFDGRREPLRAHSRRVSVGLFSLSGTTQDHIP